MQLLYFLHTLLNTNVNRTRMRRKCWHMREPVLLKPQHNIDEFIRHETVKIWIVLLSLNCFLLSGTFTVTFWSIFFQAVADCNVSKIHINPKLFVESNFNKFYSYNWKTWFFKSLVIDNYCKYVNGKTVALTYKILKARRGSLVLYSREQIF